MAHIFQSPSSRRLRVFLCHSSSDKPSVRQLYQRLKSCNIDPWLDEEDLLPGQDWELEIRKAVRTTDAVIVCLSIGSIGKTGFVQKEIKLALDVADEQPEGTIFIIPLKLEECEMPQRLRHLQWVAYYKNDGFYKLVRSLKLRSESSTPKLASVRLPMKKVFEELNKSVTLSSDKYIQPWSLLHPGCLIFLLDQSASMSLTFGAAQPYAGRKICDMLTTFVNSYLSELIATNIIINSDGSQQINAQMDIAILGYGSSEVHPVISSALAKQVFVTLPELRANVARIEMRTRMDVDDRGEGYEIQVPFPIWVEPKAEGDAPMSTAIEYARELAERWVTVHPNNYPPVVINITGGMPSDGDPLEPALQLHQVSTTDGQALLYNIYIGAFNARPIIYPASEDELPDDPYVKRLFLISSVLPMNARLPLESIIGKPLQPGAKGVIVNGDATSLRLITPINDLPASQPLDPNK